MFWIRGDEPINYRESLCQISQRSRAAQLFSHTKLDMYLFVAYISGAVSICSVVEAIRSNITNSLISANFTNSLLYGK